MYSVRFHLGRGPYYKMWQVKNLKDKSVAPVYYEPDHVQLRLLDCELICNENKAKRVHAAGIKDVCGWIKCGDLFLRHLRSNDPIDVSNFSRLYFNPIVDPVWRVQEDPSINMNGAKFNSIITSGKRVYTDEPLLQGV